MRVSGVIPSNIQPTPSEWAKDMAQDVRTIIIDASGPGDVDTLEGGYEGCAVMIHSIGATVTLVSSSSVNGFNLTEDLALEAGRGVLLNFDSKAGYWLSTVSAASGGGGGGGTSYVVQKEVTQVGHGFDLGRWVYFDGANWDIADITDSEKTTVGIVSEIIDADTFMLSISGWVTLTTGQWDAVTGETGGLTEGDYYWLSTSGEMTKTPSGTLRQSLGFAQSATEFVVQLSEPFSTSAAAASISVIGAAFDGGGSALVVGTKVYVSVPFDCIITEVVALADVSGSVVVDVWKDTYTNYPPTDADSITASAPVTISSATKSTDATLTGWTKTVTAGDIIAFNVDSCSTITKLNVQLIVERT